MILKYLNGKISDGEEFDYIMLSDTSFSNNYMDGIIKDMYRNDYDIALIHGKTGILKYIYSILIKLSLSVKRGLLLPCAAIYSKNAYNYLIARGIMPGDLDSRIKANSVLLRNRDFTYKIYRVLWRCSQPIPFKTFLNLIFKQGNLLKYIIVGITGVIVNELILLLLHGPLGSDLSIIPAIEISIIYNFILNNKFTFRGKNHFYYRLLKYNAFNLLGFGVNLGVYYSAISLKTNIYAADFLGILVAFVITYTTSTLIVW